MTSKFAENIHNLGYATGQALHRFFLFTSDKTCGDLSALTPPPSNGYVNLTETIGIPRTLSSLSSALSSLPEHIIALPNRYRIWWMNLLRSDPLHVLVETLLIVMCVILVTLQRRADWRFSQERKKGAPTEDEEEELIREWKEERRRPLGGGGGNAGEGSGVGTSRIGTEVGSGLIVEKIEGSRIFLHEDSRLATNYQTSSDGRLDTIQELPSSALNFATLDYLSTTSSPSLRDVARRALLHYGCGSCGPRGFYGTIDAHLEAEEAMSTFLGTEGAILYSDGASAATSTVAAFAKRGDLLIVDEGVSDALLVGVTLSRANVRYFRHNDVKDLRRVLEKVAAQDAALQRKPTDQRRFLIVEGLYRNWGTLAPLREIVRLKEEFRYRLILDDSHGVGTLGENGRGSLEHAGLKPMVHCEILTFSLENALGSVGGMTVGSEEVVDHQRLSGAGYCFSASAPPFLSKVCLASVRRLEGKLEDDVITNDMGEGEDAEATKAGEEKNVETPSTQNPQEELAGSALLDRLRQNISNLYGTLTDSSHPHALKLHNRLVITSNPLSPILYLRLADNEAVGQTRVEQTAVLDRISHHCLVEGGVAIVSTGGHVRKHLQLVPEPALRVAAHVCQSRDDVEVLVKALGEAVESVLLNNDGNILE